jgi:hypothetical protein
MAAWAERKLVLGAPAGIGRKTYNRNRTG